LSFGLRSKLLSNWPAIDGTRLFIERLSHRRRDGPWKSCFVAYGEPPL
jgi:hypothetical protein